MDTTLSLTVDSGQRVLTVDTRRVSQRTVDVAFGRVGG